MRRITICSFVFLVSVSSLKAHTFAQLALGGGFEAVLFVVNLSQNEQGGQVFLRQGNDEDWASEWSFNGVRGTGFAGFEFTLPGFGSEKFIIRGDSQARAGYLEVVEDDLVGVSFFYNFLDGTGQLVDSTGIPENLSAASGEQFVFAVEKNQTVNTGFAWAPSFSTQLASFDIELRLYDTQGNLVDSKTVTFGGHLAKFFDQVFDNVPDNFIGMVTISPGDDLELTVLRLETTSDGFQLTSVPPGLFDGEFVL